jgi:hypothetical protein
MKLALDLEDWTIPPIPPSFRKLHIVKELLKVGFHNHNNLVHVPRIISFLQDYARHITTPQDIIQCPINVLRHEILLMLDGRHQRFPLFFAMFERMDHTCVQQFCDTDFSRVRIVTLSCLDEMGSLTLQDNLALYELINGKVQTRQYHVDPPNVHARLALACMKLIIRCDANCDHMNNFG